MADTSTNIAPLITPLIVSTLNGSQILAFGDQLKKQATQTIIAAGQDFLKNKTAALADIINKIKQASIDQAAILKKASEDYANKKITKEEYKNVRDSAKTAYKETIASLKESKKQIQDSIKAELNDYVKNVKTQFAKIKINNIKLKKNILQSQVRSKKNLAKQVLKNPKNLLLIYPGIGLLLTNAFINFVSQRKQLEKQVDVVNFYIDTKVIDEQSVLVATYLKNNTIKAINAAIAKLEAIQKIIKTINTALKIVSIALAILTLFPIPVPMPVLKIFDKISQIISGLNSILTPFVVSLDNEIRKLKELINKFKPIVIKLNNKTLSILTDAQLINLIQTILPVGNVEFAALTAQPLTGVVGAVNIGGRIVYLNTPTGSLTGGVIGGIITSASINPISASTTTSSIQIVTGSTGTTNGTGTGLTTTGGSGTGGINVGATGTISNITGAATDTGTGIGLDNGILTSGLDVEGEPIVSIDLEQFSIAGLNEFTLDQLESFSLETLEEPQPLSQVPSLSDQANLYKGFKFQIKEEQNPKFVIRGTIKRRYAVAINRQGIEVLKSEYSYTLDPNDLVDQLKLVIDKQKLQG